MIRGSRPPIPALAPLEPSPAAIEPLTVRVSAAVRLTGISRSRLYELIQSGDLEVKKVGRSTLIPFAALKRLVATDDI